jgi:YHS domain-containing protein
MRLSSLLGLTLVIAACSSNPRPAAPAAPAAVTAAPAPAATAAPAPADLKAPGEAKIGDTTKCPISGEQFVVSESSPHAEYEGKTYYFCCPDCAGKFKSDPSKYAHGS